MREAERQLNQRTNMILKIKNRWWQLCYGGGCNDRRVIWWPRHGQISLRIHDRWWLGLHWGKSSSSSGSRHAMSAPAPGYADARAEAKPALAARLVTPTESDSAAKPGVAFVADAEVAISTKGNRLNLLKSLIDPRVNRIQLMFKSTSIFINSKVADAVASPQRASRRNEKTEAQPPGTEPRNQKEL